MKRGTRAIMPVHLDIDLDLVQSIQFLFVQDKTRMIVNYPSDKATRNQDNINIYFDERETFAFKSNANVQMDTHVHLIDSDLNPETNIIKFLFSPTLFTMEEISHD